MASIALINADSLRIPLADGSVHMVACSPPYWALRSYLQDDDPLKASELGAEKLHDCLAWARGERPCAECYVCAMRRVAAEVWRVLRDDGVFWLNLGDSYAGGKTGRTDNERSNTDGFTGHKKAVALTAVRQAPPGLKPKDLVGIPWRVALALQADGWYLRSDCIWSKPNPMPESVRDRPTRSHEYVFLLAKSARYFYDQDAIRDEYSATAKNGGPQVKSDAFLTAHGDVHRGFNLGSVYSHGGRNTRTVWEIATEPFSGAHFATWPTALVEKMILAGTSSAGCCPKCAAPWVRVTRKGEPEQAPRNPNPARPYDAGSGLNNGNNGSTLHMVRRTETAGWRPSCKCDAGAPTPCTVLDPFAGSGTTGVVARRHGRNFVGLDLSFAYLREQARERLGLAALERFENGTAVHDPNDYSDLFTRNGQ